MTESHAESWTTGSGLPDDFDGVISDAQFTTDANIQNGEVLILRLTITPDEEAGLPDQVKDYSLGKGWESVDGGKTARTENGKDLKINNQSKMGKLMDRIGLPENDGGLGLFDMMAGRGSAKDIKTWIGLNFHWLNQKDSFKTKEGDIKEYSTFLPSAYLPSGVPTPAAKSNDKAAESNLRDQVNAIAKESSSQEDFQGKALALDGIANDDALLAEVVDGSLFAKASA